MNEWFFEILFLVFILSMFSFWVISYERSSQIRTFKDYFRIDNNKENSKAAINSLVIGNVTLATGMMYVASLAQNNILIAFSAPLGCIIGYLLISKFIMFLPQNNDSLLDALKKDAKILYKTISFIAILAFYTIIAFEVYLSSQLLSMLFGFPNQTSNGDLSQKDLSLILAVIIYICTLIYVFYGGIKSVVFTDKIQLIASIIMLFVLLILLYTNISDESNFSIWQIVTAKMQLDGFNSMVLIIVVFLTAITTQFYNILNISVGASFEHAKQKNIFKWTGIWIFLINTVFILIGILSLQFTNAKYLGIDEIFNFFLGNSLVNLFVIVLIQLGMLSILIATIDSTMIATSNYIYSNIFNKEYNNEISFKSKFLFVLVPNLIIVIFLLFIFGKDINIANYLFMILLPLSMLSIVMMIYIYSIHKFKDSIVKSIRFQYMLIIIIAICFILSSYMFFIDNENYQHLISIIGLLVLPIILFIYDYMKYKKNETMLSESMEWTSQKE